MQQGIVLMNGTTAGTITYMDDGLYVFRYTDNYFADARQPAISLTLPKTRQQYEANELFPFFYGLLAEGINKDIQCRMLKIDEQDDFTRLLKTAGTDTIGAITIKEITQP